MIINLILAQSENGIIGNNNSIPWICSRDLMRFKELTMGKTVVMGFKTFASIKAYSNKTLGVLPGRTKIVFTSKNLDDLEDTFFISSKTQLLKICEDLKKQEIWIIGGKTIYDMFSLECNNIYLTIIKQNVVGDTKAPILPIEKFKLVNKKILIDCEFYDYERK